MKSNVFYKIYILNAVYLDRFIPKVNLSEKLVEAKLILLDFLFNFKKNVPRFQATQKVLVTMGLDVELMKT